MLCNGDVEVQRNRHEPENNVETARTTKTRDGMQAKLTNVLSRRTYSAVTRTNMWDGAMDVLSPTEPADVEASHRP